MELLGLLAVLFVLYLFIAPAVAWGKANAARAASEELKSTLDARTRDLGELRKQIASLREQQGILLQRFENLGAVAPEQPSQREAAPPAPVVRAATPPAPGRSTRADFSFDPAEFGVPQPATPERLGPASPTGVPIVTPELATAPSEPIFPAPVSPVAPVEPPQVPTHQRWNLEPIEPDAASTAALAVTPTEPVVAKVEPVATPRSAWSEASSDGQAARPATPEREAVWTPKPPLGRPQPVHREREPSELESKVGEWLQAAKGWLFGGNLVAKIGLMILFIGVAFLLRYASAYVVVPIEVRLAGIAAGAIAMLGWGWHIRASRPGIALPVQGAALATLMLVTFGAFKIYHLLPATPTFALLLVLVAFTCVLAVLQDALWLAVFGIVGGFAVPILTSSGGGSHVALFSYYALLNAGILAIAWKRSWRSLNFLGFLFTFLIGTAWGVQRYEAAHYASAQFFLALFVVFYAAIAILYAWRQAPQLKSYVDASLVF
ncbi:MAG: DUF2339 domain-containing protein, partial [Burkholderiaceae bacterium]|nr:DUF2339 domain-containing protein [Burkholderiaceae bacterium]